MRSVFFFLLLTTYALTNQVSTENVSAQEEHSVTVKSSTLADSTVQMPVAEIAVENDAQNAAPEEKHLVNTITSEIVTPNPKKTQEEACDKNTQHWIWSNPFQLIGECKDNTAVAHCIKYQSFVGNCVQCMPGFDLQVGAPGHTQCQDRNATNIILAVLLILVIIVLILVLRAYQKAREPADDYHKSRAEPPNTVALQIGESLKT